MEFFIPLITSNEKLMCTRTISFCSKQRLLAVAFLVASFVSCNKEVSNKSDETLLNDSALNGKVSTRLLGGLLWADNIELLTWLSLGVSRHTSTSYGITAVTSPIYQGYRSARFELRSSDPENHGGTRSELSFPVALSLNRWYSYALFAPSALYKYDDDDEVISQWHQGDGTPALCLRVKADRIYIRILGVWNDLGVFEKDKWQAWVMHIKHSPESDGLIEIWRNGVKVMSRYGANMYDLDDDDDLHYPYLKMGIYKSDWNGSSTTSTSLRVLYYDDIKIGNEWATYSTMVPTPNSTTPISTTPTEEPTTTTPTTSTTTLGITDIRLINAATEKEIMSIANGQTISLSALGLNKVNIRVTTTTPSASVKMELSGPTYRRYTDSESPYALHGDDDDGNYYYGNWDPPALGTYTLKATPYTEDDAEGTAGISKTITFTFVN
jgi:hypothetical protein